MKKTSKRILLVLSVVILLGLIVYFGFVKNEYFNINSYSYTKATTLTGTPVILFSNTPFAEGKTFSVTVNGETTTFASYGNSDLSTTYNKGPNWLSSPDDFLTMVTTGFKTTNLNLSLSSIKTLAIHVTREISFFCGDDVAAYGGTAHFKLCDSNGECFPISIDYLQAQASVTNRANRPGTQPNYDQIINIQIIGNYARIGNNDYKFNPDLKYEIVGIMTTSANSCQDGGGSMTQKIDLKEIAIEYASLIDCSCLIPSADNGIENTYIDNNNCQHYKLFQNVKTSDCLCWRDQKVCGADKINWAGVNSPCAGAMPGSCVVSDCSTYQQVIINSDFGGVLPVCSLSCVQNQIISFDDIYYICKESSYKQITSLILLTPAEQQALLDQINSLELLYNEKAALIRQLNLSLVEQGKLVDQLNINLNEKLLLVKELQSNLDSQTILISQLQTNLNEKIMVVQQLTSDINKQAEIIKTLTSVQTEQVQIIQGLNLKISEQAGMITTLSNNLQDKINLVNLLQATNQEQAELITAMRLSFADQAAIIDGLDNKISDDAEIIQALNLNLADQNTLISNLKLTNTELSQLIIDLKLNLADQGALIKSLNLTIEEDAQIIRSLNLTLQEEAQIIKALNLNLAEQAEIISKLEYSNKEQAEIIARLQSNINEQLALINQLSDSTNLGSQQKTELINLLQDENAKLNSSKKVLLFVVMGSILTIIILLLFIFFRKK